jgi:glutathione S-transferase
MADIQDFKPLKNIPLPLAVIGWIVRFFSPDYESRTKLYISQQRALDEQSSSSSTPLTVRKPPYRLTSIAISHYVEKVRWALSLGSRDYYEDGHAPGFHVAFSLAATGNKTTMTPLLTTYDPETPTLVDSTAILRYLCKNDPDLAWLYPVEHEAGILELEELIDQELGVPTRRWVYANLLPHSKETKKLMMAELPGAERNLIPLIYPGMRFAFSKIFHLTDSTSTETQVQIQAFFDRINSLLSDGRQYLVGGRFSAADLTFAALAYPLIFPPEFDQRFGLSEAPKVFQDKVFAFRDQQAGQFALRIYKEHRFSPDVPEAQRFVSVHSTRTPSASL